jgi:hypothetical protein
MQPLRSVPAIDKWSLPIERVGFAASREVCRQVVEMWLMGNDERSIVAILGCTQKQWEGWKRDESFNYLVGCLTDPVRGLVHGRFTRLTAKALDRIEECLDAGNISPRQLAALTQVLVDKQIEIEKRITKELVEPPDEVKALWKKLGDWSKAHPLEGQVVNTEVE